MKLPIFDIGYVGLVNVTCLAEVDHHVMSMDVDPVKIANLNAGMLPIWGGLVALLERNVKEGLMQFTTDAVQPAEFSSVRFIAVGRTTS